MPLTLYYKSCNPLARSVDLVIRELGLTVEYKIVEVVKKDLLSPEFIKINPLCMIPLIDDDGFILWESRAILTYLVSKYGKNDFLYPKDLEKRAIVDQRLHYSNDLWHILERITVQIAHHNKTKVCDEQKAKLIYTQKNVEKLLEGHKYIAGDSLTVADYSYITMMDLLDVYSPMEDKFPNLTSWMKRCATTMKDFDELNNNKGSKEFISLIKKGLSLR